MPSEITEAKVYEALGLQAPAPAAGADGANVQEPAAPAVQTEDPNQGAKAQEPAVPASGSDDGNPTPAQEDNPIQDGQEPGKKPMDEKQRHENAARRRQQEQQAAVDAAVQQALQAERKKADAEWAGFFEKAGLKNTFTDEPIKTREQYTKWFQEYQSKQMQQDLKDGKLTPEMLQQLISQNPVMQQVQKIVGQDTAAKKLAQQQAEQTRIDGEIAEISKLNPNVKTVGDLLSMPKYQEFKSYVDKGYSYLDSYRLSHMDEIANARAEQARQTALNNARGKDHLVASGKSQGTGAASVPPEIMRQYRLFNPKATDAQIQAHYNKTLKK